MKTYIRAICFLLLIAIFHFIANAMGLYTLQIEQGSVWFDNVLHFLVGVAFAQMFLKLLIDRNPDVSNLRIAVSVIIFVIILAVGWELLEFIFMKLLPAKAQDLKIYSPSLLEASEDVISNALGAIAFVLYKLKFK